MIHKKIRFDGWVVDLDSGDLERDGARSRLQEQPLQVLKELISQAGSLVTRERLIAILWPKGVVDFDTGLNTAVRKLRSALGDPAETPRYIETLPRRGYRFIATLDPEEQAALPSAAQVPSPLTDRASPAVPTPPPAAEPGAQPSPGSVSPAPEIVSRESRRYRWVAGVTFFALLAGAGLFTAWNTSQPRRNNPFDDARFSRLTDMSGNERAAAISRDGKLAAFISDHDGRNDVWITEVGSGRYRNLTQGRALELVNPSVRTLGFSPDASRVTIWQRSSDGARSGEIKIDAISSSGGSLQSFLPKAAEVTWSADGKRVLYHTSAPGDPMFVKELRGEPQQIYAAQAPRHCHFQIWSPDDAYIYMVCGVPQSGWDIWRIQPDGSHPERITSHNALLSHLVALDAHTLAYLAADVDGIGQGLYVIDVNRREPQRVNSGLERYSSLAANAGGLRLVATVVHQKNALWRVSIADRPAGSPSAAVRIAEAAGGLSPRVGQECLIYASSRGGRQGISKLAGSTISELWSHPVQSVMGGPAVSSDGRKIAFTASDGSKFFLYVMQSDGSQVRVLTDSLALRGNPAWSPDGLSVVSAVAQDNVPHLTTVYLNGAPPTMLVSEYALDPAWSPDGRFLLYSGADIGTTFPLRAVASDGKTYALPAPILTRGARRVVFSRDGQAIVLLRGEIGHKNFWSIDLKSGAERQLTELPPDFDVRDFDLSADNKEILFDRGEANSEIALIERGR